MYFRALPFLLALGCAPEKAGNFQVQGFTATVDAQGIAIDPVFAPDWTWSLEEIRQGNRRIDGDAHISYANQDRVVLDRGVVLERYLREDRVVEQQFVLPHPLDGTGDLVIQGSVRSSGHFRRDGRGWTWSRVRLGDVTVFDAEGNVLPASMSVHHDRTRIVVDGAALARAPYPVLIDPEIGIDDQRISDTVPVGTGSILDVGEPHIAWDGVNEQYLVTWHGEDDGIDPYQSEDQRYGQLVAVDGTEIGTDDFWIGDIGLNSSNDRRITFGGDSVHNAFDNVFATTFEGRVEPTESTVWARLIDAPTGTMPSPAVQVAGSVDPEPSDPRIAWNATDNEYLVVFGGWDTAAAQEDVYAQRLDGTLAPIGTADPRLTVDGFTQHASVAWNSIDNLYLVVWRALNIADNDWDIFGLILNPDGTPSGGEFRISDMGPPGPSAYQASFPAIAYDATNNVFLVVWQGDDDTFTADNEHEIWGQLVSGTGVEVGVDFRISSAGVDLDATIDAEEPSVTWCAATDEYFVTWHANLDPAYVLHDEIYGQRLSALGALVGSEVQLSQGAPAYNLGPSYAPSAACDAAGTTAVAWQGELDFGVDDEIYLQRYAHVDTDGDGIVDVEDPCPDLIDIDTDGDGVCDAADPCPLDPLDDSDGDGTCDSDDLCPGFDDTLDVDLDGQPDDCDPCPDDNPDDSDGDGICESADSCFGDNATGDGDADAICDSDDACPTDPLNDADNDGICDGVDACVGDNLTGDSDGDGACNDTDPCPLDALDDSDGDGSCDSFDLCSGDDATGDVDGDGVCGDTDPCPLDALDDSDGDGSCDTDDLCVGDDASGDLDLDGTCNDIDPCPFSAPDDADADGICDNVDSCFGDNTTGDVDADGVCDDLDPCPGYVGGDLDGDGICDAIDACFGDNSTGDSDGDGACDDQDLCNGDDGTGDSDGDGVCNDLDACPFANPDDVDLDGICDDVDLCLGDNATGDSDGDGTCDDTDPCPTDAPDDTDGDGVCESVDVCVGDDASGDTDGDGVCDDTDPCPTDSPDDTDADGVCDSVDLCLGQDASGDGDGDGICDDVDPCPLDAPDDADGDGVCESVDVCTGDDATGDTDSDGVCDDLDPCPLDPADDSDGDGICDGADSCDGDDAAGDSDGDGTCDDLDPCPGDAPDDVDGDGQCDSDDPCPFDATDDSDGDGICDSADQCAGFDDLLDDDSNGIPDGCQPDDPDGGPPEDKEPGCGCSSPGAGSPGILGLLLAGLLVRRRATAAGTRQSS